MLDENGGIIDDLITYFLSEDHFRVVVNAGTREKDLQWMTTQAADFDCEVEPMTHYAMIAVQGPNARERVFDLLAPDLRAIAESLGPFTAAPCGDLFVARTGYTGEDGFEIIVSAEGARPLWDALLSSHVKPCGLGARDSLRLEAGMNLYGQDMDESVTPLESGLAWTLAMDDDREFIGRSALESQQSRGVNMRFTGIVLADRGVLRHDQTVKTDDGEGVITSGGFSPTLERAIGFARLPRGDSERCQVEIRGRSLDARIIRPPFVRSGKPSAKMQALLDAMSSA
jgi:aminomethyltransferase